MFARRKLSFEKKLKWEVMRFEVAERGVIETSAARRRSQARIVHEHHAIHELHAIVPAGLDHFANVGHGIAAGFFAQNMFARLGSAQHPLFAQAGRDRDVNRVNIWRGD